MEPQASLAQLSDEALLTATSTLVQEGCGVEAQLLLHLAEIDERKLYRERSFSSMFAFCVEELGFSEDAAYSRILVARAGRQLPDLFDALGSGRVHLTGLRLLVPHLTAENHRDVLQRATGKSKREIEELLAAIAPQPPVPAMIRKLPAPSPSVGKPALPSVAPAPVPSSVASDQSAPSLAPDPAHPWAMLPVQGTNPTSAPSQTPLHRPVVLPLSEDTFKVQFTASRAFRDKLRHAQDLLRHRIPDGEIAAVMERALDLLIADVEKERFGVGRKGRPVQARETSSRHIPDAIKRAVWERDGGRCTFRDKDGRRCNETGFLEFDHEGGFARTHRHDLEGIRLLCRIHNQLAAEQMYGKAFMELARGPP